MYYTIKTIQAQKGDLTGSMTTDKSSNKEIQGKSPKIKLYFHMNAFDLHFPTET